METSGVVVAENEYLSQMDVQSVQQVTEVAKSDRMKESEGKRHRKNGFHAQDKVANIANCMQAAQTMVSGWDIAQKKSKERRVELN